MSDAMNDTSKKRLNELLPKAIDDRLTSEQRDEFDQLLADHPAARKAYLDQIAIASYLEMEFSSREMLQELPFVARTGSVSRATRRTVEFFSQPTPLSMSTAALVMVVLLTAMAFMVPPFYQHFDHAEQVSEEVVAPIYVAQITGLHEAVWEEGQGVIRLGTHLELGTEIALESGLAQITFHSGARVAVQGPAVVQLESNNAVSMKKGRLDVKVPARAIGFELETPLAHLIDLGTEFSVFVGEKGTTDIQVSLGVVESHSKSPDSPEPVRLVAGQSLRISAGGDSTKEPDELDQPLAPITFPNLAFYTNRKAWEAAVRDVGRMPFTSSNLTLANEVSVAPSENTNQGTLLTFPAKTTGLPYGFRLSMLQAGKGRAHGLIYSDHEGDSKNLPSFEDALSIGGVNGYENDDFKIEMLAESDVTAVAVVLIHNLPAASESFAVYDKAGKLLQRTGRIPGMDNKDETFLGVVSNVPIGHIVFDEDTGDDDIAVSEVLLATKPEPKK